MKLLSILSLQRLGDNVSFEGWLPWPVKMAREQICSMQLLVAHSLQCVHSQDCKASEVYSSGKKVNRHHKRRGPFAKLPSRITEEQA